MREALLLIAVLAVLGLGILILYRVDVFLENARMRTKEEQSAKEKPSDAEERIPLPKRDEKK